MGTLRQYILDTSRLLDGLMTNPVGRKRFRERRLFLGNRLSEIRASFHVWVSEYIEFENIVFRTTLNSD